MYTSEIEAEICLELLELITTSQRQQMQLIPIHERLVGFMTLSDNSIKIQIIKSDSLPSQILNLPNHYRS